MHGALQHGDRSPKQTNTFASTSLVKPSYDNAQSSGASFPSQVKGKKRERGDHCTDPGKRERPSRADDGDSVKCRPITNLKSEIARITEKGGIMDLDGVEKLVQLMQSDRMERNMDLISRSMLAGVMAATVKIDCLNRFVQIMGLPVLDEWLQDIHKGKVGDGSLKEGDKSVEDFLLVLLRALDKLPVNLHALQTCNIGRSVNHLRSHKNVEIQRKARSLVDTWKKRVEAEMISIDTKSGASQDILVTHNSVQKTTTKSFHGDSNITSASLSPGSLKSVSSPGSGKESQPRVSLVGGSLDVPSAREDRSSSSNQSNNCSPSWSGKEDGKSSTAGVTTVNNKVSSSTIRSRKNSSFHGVLGTGSQKETSFRRISSAHKSVILDKSQPSSEFESALEGLVSEGNSNEPVVTISNRVPNPTHGVNEESVEDCIFMSNRDSSPVLLDKQEQFDHSSKDRPDLCQSIDSKDLLMRPGDEARSPAVLAGEERSLASDDAKKLSECIPTNPLRLSKLESPSFSPMNALIESCVKYSESNSFLSLEDDVGMNLLASVATEEMSRFDLVSPTNSAERSTPSVDEDCVVNKAIFKSSPENCTMVVQSELSNDTKSDKNHTGLDGHFVYEDGLHMPKKLSPISVGDKESVPSHAAEAITAGGGNIDDELSKMDSRKSTDAKLETSNEKTGATCMSNSFSTEKAKDVKLNEEIHEEISSNVANCDAPVMEEKVGAGLYVGESLVEIALSNQFGEEDIKKDSNEQLNGESNTQQKVTEIVKTIEKKNNERINYVPNSVSECVAEAKLEKPDERNAVGCTRESGKPNFDKENVRIAELETHSSANFSISSDLKNAKDNVEEKTTIESSPMDHETQQKVEFRRYKTAGMQPDKDENCFSDVAEASCSATVQKDSETKIKFDLNKGFGADDGKSRDLVNLVTSGSTIQVLNSVPCSINPAPFGKYASITVAAAAKGAFFPPEDLVKSKGELGWKGSAATSAFRPAEPRKFLESSLGSANSPCSDTSVGRHSRFPLDIDLNVPDERVLEEIAFRDSALTDDSDLVGPHSALLNEPLGCVLTSGSGCLNLDLNRADEANDNAHCSTISYHKGEGSMSHIEPLGGLPTCDIRRDFDLNDGPVVDCATPDHFSTRKQVKGSIPSQLNSAGFRMNSPVAGNFSSWFPPGNTYSAVSVPAILPDRGEQPFPVLPLGAPQRTFGHMGVAPVTPDVYRGSMLASTPAVPFASSSFQFPVFPFGTTFPLPSATFSVGANSYADSSSGTRLFAPPLNPQFLGPVGSVTSQLPRPYVVNIPDNSVSSILENNRKWGRQGLDLNAGPGTIESEVKEESFSQHSVASQVLPEEQAWMYSVSGGVLKRKEPEGPWDNENFRCKQFSWQ